MSAKYYAILALCLYTTSLVAALSLAEVSVRPQDMPQSDVIYVVEIEKPTPPPPPPPPPQPKVKEAPRHERPSTKVDNSRQVSGTDQQTRTVNQRALFKSSKSGADEPRNAGNPYAKQDTVATASGTGGGLNPVGTDALDEGLQGRGLVGALPQPIYPPGNKGGKVVVRVVVNQSGQVTDATYEQKGSTTSDTALVNAALAAARKARFTESKAFVQGGRITYNFKMK